jgi:hypothetical protein
MLFCHKHNNINTHEQASSSHHMYICSLLAEAVPGSEGAIKEARDKLQGPAHAWRHAATQAPPAARGAHGGTGVHAVVEETELLNKHLFLKIMQTKQRLIGTVVASRRGQHHLPHGKDQNAHDGKLNNCGSHCGLLMDGWANKGVFDGWMNGWVLRR